MSEVKDEILKMANQGWVSFRTIDGIMTANIKDFVSQPSEGILYDLNRNTTAVLADTKDPRWINDFAVSQVITYLKDKNDEYLETINNLKEQLQNE